MRFFVFILAGLLAASLAPWSGPAVVASCPEPAERALAETRAAMPTLHGDVAVAVDAITQSGWKPCALDASRFMAAAPAVPRTDCDPLGAHSGRAPPLA